MSFDELVRKIYSSHTYVTTHENEHTHHVYLWEGGDDGYTSWDHGHSHEWKIENGKIVISEEDGHTHSVPYGVLPQGSSEGAKKVDDLSPKKKKKKKDKYRITKEDGSGTDV